jgi:hypothetical protein
MEMQAFTVKVIDLRSTLEKRNGIRVEREAELAVNGDSSAPSQGQFRVHGLVERLENAERIPERQSCALQIVRTVVNLGKIVKAARVSERALAELLLSVLGVLRRRVESAAPVADGVADPYALLQL